MLATVDTAAGWIGRHPTDPARGAMTALAVSGQTAIVEAVPCWLDHRSDPCVPDGDGPLLAFVRDAIGTDGPFARTHLPGWPTPALLVGRTIPHLHDPADTTSRTRGDGVDHAGRRRSPVEVNRTPMWLTAVDDGDPLLDALADLALGLGVDTRHDGDLAPAERATLLLPAAAPRWN